MSKKSDDSIERIFRQALTHYDTKFEESDWLKMEKLLNEEAVRKAAVRSKRIKGTAYTLTGLTGLIIAVYFLAFNNPSGSIASVSDSVSGMQASDDLTKKGNVKDENSSEGLLSATSPNEAAEPNRDSQKQEVSDDAINKSETLESKSLEKNPSEINESSRKSSQAILPSEENKNKPKDGSIHNRSQQASETGNNESRPDGFPSFKNSEPKENNDDIIPGENLTNKGNTQEIVPMAGDDKAATDNKNDVKDDRLKGGKSSDLPGQPGMINPDSTRSTTLRDENQKEDLYPVSPQSQSQNMASQKDTLTNDETLRLSRAEDSVANTVNRDNENKKIKPSSRWSIGIVLAPEFSTTSLSRYTSPGESIGLRIGYQISSRFSINTGVIRSTKKYKDDGDAYSPRNPAYWRNRTNGVVPEKIDSKCLVYELPLGVQFDAIQRQKSRLFISTAISSYFMISQAYDYTFESPNPGADMGWRSQGSESYWFSVGMVSAGYERYIHRSFAIGIEPYLKISLSEIGWPNVKLFSTGAYVTLRYKFMSRKNSFE